MTIIVRAVAVPEPSFVSGTAGMSAFGPVCPWVPNSVNCKDELEISFCSAICEKTGFTVSTYQGLYTVRLFSQLMYTIDIDSIDMNHHMKIS